MKGQNSEETTPTKKSMDHSIRSKKVSTKGTYFSVDSNLHLHVYLLLKFPLSLSNSKRDTCACILKSPNHNLNFFRAQKI